MDTGVYNGVDNSSGLSLALLGRPEVRWRGQVLAFRTRKALALLAYLAAEAGPHPRAELAGLLWPEGEPAQARGMLRTNLQHLRQALAPAGMPVVLAEGDTLSLARGPWLAVDLDALAEAAHNLRATLPAGRAALQAQLSAAAGLSRGDFLHGFNLNDVPPFDHWVQAQQPLWRDRAEAVFDALIQLQYDAGDLPGALATARRWASLGWLSGAAAHWQMRLLFARGAAPEALRVFDAHAAALAHELGAQPQPELAALAERIRRQPLDRPTRTSGAPAAATRQHLSTAAGQHASRGGSAAAAPMVGRGSEFAQLIALMHQFRSGQPRAALITGEAGIGKTRLAHELAGSARADGLDLWEARALEAIGRVPYQVVLDAVRARVERENAPDDLLSDVWLAELSRLLPELRDRYPDLPPALAVGEAEAQARLLEAVARWLHACAARAPVVFMVDDLQWADAASLDLLTYLARQSAEQRSPLLLLLTVRAEDRGAPAVTGWIANLGRVLPLAELSIGGLALAHTQQWVQGLAGFEGQGLPEALLPALRAFSEWLQAETGGQPFFIAETIRALREQGLLGGAAPGEAVDVLAAARLVRDPQAVRAALDIPTGVRDIIRARTQRLSPPAAELLAAAAVLGQAAAFDVLQAVAQLAERDALAALDELLRARLLLELDAERGARYLVAHDKIRQLTYASASGARRAALHRRAFEALQAGRAGDTSGPAAAPSLAYHALAAGLHEQGARWSLAAGDQAMTVFDARRAIEHYQRARQALPGAFESLDASAYLRLGRAYELNGEPALAEQAYLDQLAAARAALSPALEVAALSRLATLAVQSLDEPRMNDLRSQMIRAAEAASDTRLQAEVEWTLAQTHNYLGGLADAQVHGERALALAAEAGDDDLQARCLNILAYIYNAIHLPQPALDAATDSAARYAALGNRAMESDSLAQAAVAEMRLCHAARSVALGRVCRAKAEAVDNLWGIVNSDMQMAVVLVEVGLLGEAHANVTAAQRMAQDHQLGFLNMLTHITQGAIQRSIFQLEAAQRQLAEVLRHPPPLSVATRAAMELVATEALMGNWAAAHALLVQWPAERAHSLFLAERPVWLEAEVWLRAGEPARAEAHVAQWASLSGDSPRARLAHDRAVAHLLARQGRPDQALPLLWRAEQAARAAELPGELWQIEAALGEAQPAAGDLAGAQAARAEALSIIRRLGESFTDDSMRRAYLDGAARQMAQMAEHVAINTR